MLAAHTKAGLQPRLVSVLLDKLLQQLRQVVDQLLRETQRKLSERQYLFKFSTNEVINDHLQSAQCCLTVPLQLSAAQQAQKSKRSVRCRSCSSAKPREASPECSQRLLPASQGRCQHCSKVTATGLRHAKGHTCLKRTPQPLPVGARPAASLARGQAGLQAASAMQQRATHRKARRACGRAAARSTAPGRMRRTQPQSLQIRPLIRPCFDCVCAAPCHDEGLSIS